MNISKADYDELVRLREGKYGIKFYFIARDEDGSVFAWIAIPHRTQMYGRRNYWITGHDDFEEIDSNLFKYLKWTDEPYNISAAIADYEREHKEGV